MVIPRKRLSFVAILLLLVVLLNLHPPATLQSQSLPPFTPNANEAKAIAEGVPDDTLQPTPVASTATSTTSPTTNSTAPAASDAPTPVPPEAVKLDLATLSKALNATKLPVPLLGNEKRSVLTSSANIIPVTTGTLTNQPFYPPATQTLLQSSLLSLPALLPLLLSTSQTNPSEASKGHLYGMSSENDTDWLLDIVGDSFSRHIFERVSHTLKGSQSGDTFAAFDAGPCSATSCQKHQDHMYCCPNVKSSECKLIRIEKGNDVWRAVAKQTDSVCVTWMWANVFSGYPIVPRMHGHATMGIAPQAVLLNPGLHCAFKQSRALGIDACNKTHVEAILESVKPLTARGVSVALDTPPTIYYTVHKREDCGDAEKGPCLPLMNGELEELKAIMIKAVKDAESQVYVRDIMEWSKVFHKDGHPCMERDGLHIECNLYDELPVVWWLNQKLGRLKISGEDPTVLELVLQ